MAEPEVAIMSPSRNANATPVFGGRGMVRKGLLACGILSSLLYVATNVIGGMLYEGYSFTSQMVSELMAIDAPSEAFVDPLFIIYGVLTVAFGVGVVREAAGRNRPLRITGALLIGYAVAGFTGPTLFEMYPRGAGSLESDTPHIVLTGGGSYDSRGHGSRDRQPTAIVDGCLVPGASPYRDRANVTPCSSSDRAGPLPAKANVTTCPEPAISIRNCPCAAS